MWKLNTILLNEWIKCKVFRDISKYFEIIEKENTILKHTECNKAVLREKTVAVNAYIIKGEKSQIDSSIFHLKKLAKAEKI